MVKDTTVCFCVLLAGPPLASVSVLDRLPILILFLSPMFVGQENNNLTGDFSKVVEVSSD